MSTISQTPKINTVRNLNARNVNLVIIAALLVTFVAIFNAVAGSPAAKPTDHSAYMLYRQGEWLSVPISNQGAYQIFRRGEVVSPVSNAEAYQTFRKGEVASIPVLTNAEVFHLFRLGEWASVSIPAIDLSAYHLSEGTLVTSFAEYLESERTLSPMVNSDFSQYHLSERAMTGAIAIPDLSQYVESERTLVDPLAGWTKYFESERTSMPIRFNKFQLSEWFGE